MPNTNKRESKTKSDARHRQVTAHIKSLPDKLPEQFSGEFSSTEYVRYLADLFERHGYQVSRSEESTRVKGDVLFYATVSGRGIYGEFGNDVTGGYCGDKFLADNSRSFNKSSSCPLVMQLPLTVRREAELLEHLRILGTKEGYKRAVGDWGGGESGFPYEK